MVEGTEYRNTIVGEDGIVAIITGRSGYSLKTSEGIGFVEGQERVEKIVFDKTKAVGSRSLQIETGQIIMELK